MIRLTEKKEQTTEPQTGRPAVFTDVAVTDSLSPRLEYVAGSAQSDRTAVFTTQDNGAGSVILRWEVSGRRRSCA